MNLASEKTLLILEQIATGLVGFGAYTANYVTKSSWHSLHRKLQAETYHQKYRVAQKVKKLQQAGIIILRKDEYRLTKTGKELYKRLVFDRISIKHSKWDGTWRLVSYDIPSGNNSMRNLFRNRLKQWGFRLVHKSLWILPWECENEVQALAHRCGLEKNIIMMTTRKPVMEDRLIKIFNLH